MNIEKIKYFIDLVECRNFTETAKKNFVSQTTISQQIASLESMFDNKLINRKQIPIQPTPAGWIFYKEALIIYKQYLSMKQKMMVYKENNTALLNIEYAGATDVKSLLEFMPEFLEQFRNIKVELNKEALGEISLALKKGVYDLAVTFDSEFIGHENIITKTLFEGGYSEESLKPYTDMGIETHVTNFNSIEGLAEKFKNADKLALISMPFVGAKRQAAHRNCVDAAKEAGVKQIIYTSLVNAADETNPSVEKIDHAYTEKYVADSGLDYIFLRNSQYAEAMVTNYFTFVKMGGVMQNSQGDGKMAYISRKDCAKAVAYALASKDYSKATLDINGPELMTMDQFVAYGNEATGNSVVFQSITDEENYAIFDAMGVPRTTDGKFKDGSEAPYSSEGMVTFAQAIREGKMDVFTNDFKKLTGQDALTVKYMFENSDDFQVGERHSKDN